MLRYILLSLIVISTVAAGQLSISSDGSGRTFTVDWSQGCAADSFWDGSGIVSLSGTGPNSCGDRAPWFCPADSVGNDADWEQNCNECGCGYLSTCNTGLGVCEQCDDPCDDPNACSTGETCWSNPPSDPNSCDYTWGCTPDRRNIFVHFDKNVQCNAFVWHHYHLTAIMYDVPYNTWASDSYTWTEGCEQITIDYNARWTSDTNIDCSASHGYNKVECSFADFFIHAFCNNGWQANSEHWYGGTELDPGESWGARIYCPNGGNARMEVRRTLRGDLECRRVDPGGDAPDLYLNGAKYCGTDGTWR